MWAQYLLLPVPDLVVALGDGRVDVLHLQPNAQRLFLQRVLLLLEGLDLLKDAAMLLLDLRQSFLHTHTHSQSLPC